MFWHAFIVSCLSVFLYLNAVNRYECKPHKLNQQRPQVLEKARSGTEGHCSIAQ